MRKRRAWRRRTFDWAEVLTDGVEAVVDALLSLVRW